MEKKINKKKVVILFLMFLMIALLFTAFILYKKNTIVRTFFDEYIFRKNITENTLPKISIDNVHSFAFNDHIVVLEKNVLTFYNSSANKVYSLDIEISDPLFKTSGKYLCIAERNGSKVYLISNRNIVWQKDIEGGVTSISINKNGYVAVSISDTTYKTICKLYNENGSELFTTYLSKSYIVDSAISNDNKFLALAETNFSGITIQSNVKIISVDKALSNTTDSIEYNYVAPMDNFIINIDYLNNNLICLYDSHIDIIKDNTVSEITNFNNCNVLFADINNKLVQIEKKNSSLLSAEFELQMIDLPTNAKETYTLNKEPKSIKVFGNIIAINFGTEVLFINNSGWLIKDYTSSQEIQSVVLSENLAGIIYKDKIEFLNL